MDEPNLQVMTGWERSDFISCFTPFCLTPRVAATTEPQHAQHRSALPRHARGSAGPCGRRADAICFLAPPRARPRRRCPSRASTRCSPRRRRTASTRTSSTCARPSARRPATSSSRPTTARQGPKPSRVIVAVAPPHSCFPSCVPHTAQHTGQERRALASHVSVKWWVSGGVLVCLCARGVMVAGGAARHGAHEPGPCVGGDAAGGARPFSGAGRQLAGHRGGPGATYTPRPRSLPCTSQAALQPPPPPRRRTLGFVKQWRACVLCFASLASGRYRGSHLIRQIKRVRVCAGAEHVCVAALR